MSITEYQLRAGANAKVLLLAITHLKTINDKREESGEPRRPLTVKLAIANQNVIEANDDVHIVGVDPNSGVLYVTIQVKNSSNLGDLVSIPLGDIGPIQFTDAPLSNKIAEILFQELNI